MKAISHERCDPNVYWKIGKNSRPLGENKHDNKTGCINHALKALKDRKYIDCQ